MDDKKIKIDNTIRVGAKIIGSGIKEDAWIVEGIILLGDKKTNHKFEFRLSIIDILDSEKKVLKSMLDREIDKYKAISVVHMIKDWEYWQDG